ncbi:hypothetical protein Tco_1300108, partial [Tanacetum coccineum]
MENANPPSTFEPPSQHALATGVEQMLNSMRHQVNPLFHEAASMMGRNRDFWQTLPEPSRQRQFEGIILSFMRDQEEELRQLKEYMNEIDDEFMHLSLMVIEMIEEKIRAQESEKIQKITKFPDTMESESLNTFRSLDTKTPSPYPNSSLPNQQYVRYVHTIFPSPPLVRKSTFGFKLGTKNNQNSPQVLPSFE